MTDNVFTPNLKQEPTKWLVEGLMPLGDVGIVASQPGVGKSFLLEDLAVSVAYSKKFLGFDTRRGNVLIIDEDTPKDTLDRRLSKFSNSCPLENRHTIYCHSKEGHSLKTIPKLIDSYSELKLIIIDCLVSVTGEIDIDKTAHAAGIGNFMQDIKRQDRTVLISHHVSTHSDLSIEQAMTCFNPQGLVMNNTRIVSSCDSLYLLASPDKDGILSTLFVRPVARRTTLTTGIFTTTLFEDSDTMHLDYGKAIDVKAELGKDENRALSLFEEIGNRLTVREALGKSAQYFSDYTLREHLHSLEDKGYLEVAKREAKGKLVYERIK